MELGERMKKYEYVSRPYLMCKQPVIIRLDGRAFHSFTKGFKKPFDNILICLEKYSQYFLLYSYKPP